MIRSKPYLAVGWLWYLGTLVPVLGIVQVGSQAMADRYTYVPLIGIFIMITWGISDWFSKWRYKNIGLFTASASILTILMVTSWLQVKYWSNSAVLFKHTIDVTGDNSTAQLNLGEALAEQNKVDGAVKHYYEALRIKSDIVAPHLNLGVTFREQGKLDLAMDHFLSALKLEPDCAIVHYELGDTLERKGDLSGAAKHYLEALRISPRYAAVYNNLGVMLANQNKVKASIGYISKALQINPGYAGAHYNLGKIYSNQKDTEKAIFHYKKTLQFNPDMAQALYHLSWILASCEDENFRNGQEAILLAEKLCQITQYGEPLAMDALAAAYAENGRYDEAVSIARKAIKQASKLGPKELVQGLKHRLKLYQNKTPYRQKTNREGSR
jgi:tetratricopeptide (TPR) repeat protein